MKGKSSLIKSSDGTNYLIPFLLITSLFFLWGFAHSILDILNKHFQDILHVNKAQSGLVQAAVYGGYFLAAIPAGLFMNRYGYKKGIILGLLFYAFGAFLFIPAIRIGEFWPFLMALFVIAVGLTALETAANPYATVLGPPRHAAQRLNLAQSFNGLGWIVGPLAGSLILFAWAGTGNPLDSLALPYITIGVVVLTIAWIFSRVRLPEISESGIQSTDPLVDKPLWRHRNFVFAVIAQFFYVAAQTGINSFFINYSVETFHLTEVHDLPGEGMINRLIETMAAFQPGIATHEALLNTTAGFILSFGGMMLFMTGRFMGSWFMTWIPAGRLLTLYSLTAILLNLIVILGAGIYGIIALCLIYFFMSIMFPTIFALGIKGLGAQTKRASSFIIMAIVGGAVCPPLMGYLADHSSMKTGFLVPLVCFGVVLGFAWGTRKDSRLLTNENQDS
jgi:FHS family L-fucose permease-like MFS transporter